jgi:EmrB/QacA subfamily drug resistance transporter
LNSAAEIETPPEPGERANPQAMRVLGVTCLATFMAFVDVTIVNTAFPDLERSFSESSLGSLSWIINSYTILFAALLLPAGRIADLAGRRRVFLYGVGLFTIASAACAVAPTLGLLIAARAVQGIAAAAMIPTGLALMLPEFPPERRAVAIGIWGASNSVAAAAGPVLGGALVELSDWRLVFLINVPVGVITLIAGLRVLREHAIAPGRQIPDLLGTAQLTIGIALVFLSIVKGNDWGWLTAATGGTLGAGAVLIAAALRRSASHPVPAVETSLWRIPGMAAINLSSLLAGVAFFAFILGGTLFLTSVWEYSVLEAGLAMTTGAFSSAIAAPLAGRASARYGEAPVTIAGAIAFVASAAVMTLALGTEPNFLGAWLPAGLLVGAGIGLMFPAIASAAIQGVTPQRLGAGIALNMTARQVGGGLGIAGLVALLSSNWSDPMARFDAAWLMCGAAAAGVGLVTAYSMLRARSEEPVGQVHEDDIETASAAVQFNL